MVHQKVWSNHNHWSKTDKLNFITRFISNYCLAKDVFFVMCQFCVVPHSCFCCNILCTNCIQDAISLKLLTTLYVQINFQHFIKETVRLEYTMTHLSVLYMHHSHKTMKFEIIFCSRHFGTYLFVNVSFCSLNNDDNLFSPR